MRKPFFIFNLVLGLVLSWTTAWGDFYVVAVGKRAKRTVLVSPQSTATASGTALLNALSGITDAWAENPYLIIIEPGVYDIGGNTLQMKYFVDIQGSGENVTKITGNVDSEPGIYGSSAGVVEGADYMEMRFLTVENTGGGTYAVAIYNFRTPSITNVTARAYGGTYNYGVYNYYSSPTMTNVTAKAEGGTYGYGVLNSHSAPTMTNVTAKATGGTDNYGVFNSHTSPSSSPTMTNVTATASGGSDNVGVVNGGSSPTMTNVTAKAEGGTDSYGVWNYSDSFPTMTNVTASGSGGTSYNYGVRTGTSSEVKIDHSVISGSTRSVSTDPGCKTYVGNTRLEGGAASTGTTCAGVYDENYTFYAISCP